MADIQTAGVIGAGTMGNGIAHVAARSGLRVVLFDVEQRFLDRALSTISRNMDREVAREKLTSEEKESALGRISVSVDKQALAETDFLIEAVTENLELKSDIFRDLDGIARPEVVLASNTSSISITKLGLGNQTRSKGHRHALHEPGAGDATRRNRAWAGHLG